MFIVSLTMGLQLFKVFFLLGALTAVTNCNPRCKSFEQPKNGYVTCDSLFHLFCSPECHPGFRFASKPAVVYMCGPVTGEWFTYPVGHMLPWPDCIPDNSNAPDSISNELAQKREEITKRIIDNQKGIPKTPYTSSADPEDRFHHLFDYIEKAKSAYQIRQEIEKETQTLKNENHGNNSLAPQGMQAQHVNDYIASPGMLAQPNNQRSPIRTQAQSNNNYEPTGTQGLSNNNRMQTGTQAPISVHAQSNNFLAPVGTQTQSNSFDVTATHETSMYNVPMRTSRQSNNLPIIAKAQQTNNNVQIGSQAQSINNDVTPRKLQEQTGTSPVQPQPSFQPPASTASYRRTWASKMDTFQKGTPARVTVVNNALAPKPYTLTGAQIPIHDQQLQFPQSGEQQVRNGIVQNNIQSHNQSSIKVSSNAGSQVIENGQNHVGKPIIMGTVGLKSQIVGRPIPGLSDLSLSDPKSAGSKSFQPGFVDASKQKLPFYRKSFVPVVAKPVNTTASAVQNVSAIQHYNNGRKMPPDLNIPLYDKTFLPIVPDGVRGRYENNNILRPHPAPWTQQSAVTQQSPVTQRNTVTQQSPVTQQNAGRQQSLVTPKNAVTQQSPVTQQSLVTQQNPVIQQNTGRQQSSLTQRNTVMQQSPVTQQNPVIQQNTGRQQSSLTQRNTVMQQSPVTQQNPVIQQNPVTQQNVVTQQSAFARNSAVTQQHQVEQQSQVTHQNVAKLQSPVGQQRSVTQPSVVRQSPIRQQSGVTQKIPVTQQNTATQHSSVTQKGPITQQSAFTQQIPVMQQNAVTQHSSVMQQGPIMPQSAIAQQIPVTQQTVVTQHSSVTQQSPIMPKSAITQQIPVMQQGPITQRDSITQQSGQKTIRRTDQKGPKNILQLLNKGLNKDLSNLDVRAHLRQHRDATQESKHFNEKMNTSIQSNDSSTETSNITTKIDRTVINRTMPDVESSDIGNHIQPIVMSGATVLNSIASLLAKHNKHNTPNVLQKPENSLGVSESKHNNTRKLKFWRNETHLSSVKKQFQNWLKSGGNDRPMKVNTALNVQEATAVQNNTSTVRNTYEKTNHSNLNPFNTDKTAPSINQTHHLQFLNNTQNAPRENLENNPLNTTNAVTSPVTEKNKRSPDKSGLAKERLFYFPVKKNTLIDLLKESELDHK